MTERAGTGIEMAGSTPGQCGMLRMSTFPVGSSGAEGAVWRDTMARDAACQVRGRAGGVAGKATDGWLAHTADIRNAAVIILTVTLSA